MKKVLVIGPRPRLDEFRKLELNNVEISYLDQFYVDLDQGDIPFDEIEKPLDEYFIDNFDIAGYDIVFDLSLDDNTDNFDLYIDHDDLVVFGCAVKQTLAEMVYETTYDLGFKLYGLNAIPSFINRELLEVSLYEEEDQASLDVVMNELGLAYQIVDDRVGMVTPRIICMIINEACFVLQEGTAGVKEVDQAMRLGTNYPNGPFTWADLIGIHNVYDILTALKRESGEEKYKMAPLLKKYRLKELRFYPQPEAATV